MQLFCIDIFVFQNGFENPERDETAQKKIKTNSCSVCLGLLQEFSFNDAINHPDLSKVQNYDSETFTCSISMPACIMLRERSMRISLEEKFPKYFTEGNEFLKIL